jgi:hypothetical protein
MEGFATIVTYTTDGSEPNATSPVYKEPIKCYKDMTVKFQAYMDLGDGKPDEMGIAVGADNEGIVTFQFNAPTIGSDGPNVLISSEYDGQGATNFYKLNGGEAVQGNTVTLTESATVTAYTEIKNGDYATFVSKSASQDVYVLDPIKAKKTIAVTGGDVVVDEEATATSTTGTVYKVENGTISADKKDFFVKNLEFGVVKDAAYQIDGQEAYIKMNQTNITFQVAEGDSVDVVVTCSKNSCKTLNAENDESVTTDRKCYVNVSGKTYGTDDVTAVNEDGTPGNVIKFGLGAGTWTFQKYSGTGNIFISSIEISPASTEGIEDLSLETAKNGAVYNVAGQKVSEGFKGLVIKDGKKFVVK